MSEWEETTLGTVANLCLGKMLDQKKNQGSFRPYLNNVAVRWGYFDLNNLPEMRFLDSELDRYGVKKGDIVACEGGEPGRCAIWKNDKPILIQKALHRIRVHEGVDSRFVYYQFRYRTQRGEYDPFVTGSTIKHLPGEALAKLPLSLPPLPTQRRIAAVLSALDDKIELNNRINANLEAQAQALFRSWFVDFEPWGGEMPEGWKVVSVGDLNPILETGKRPKGGAVETGIPSIGAENVKQLGVFDFSSAKFIPEDFAKTMTRGRVYGYELLLYKDGGKPGTFLPHFSMFGEGFPYKDCFINEHVFKLDFGNRGFNIFSYFMFQTDEIFQWLETSGMKAAIPGINQNNVLEIKIPHPDNPKIAEFGAIAEPLFARIFKGCNENRTLASLRDALLPKLMRGEIDVEKVEVAG